MPTYLVCGLRIASPIPLPSVPTVPDAEAVDVVVHPAARPPCADGWSEAVIRPVHVSRAMLAAVPVVVADRPAADETLRLRYAEGLRVHVSPPGDAVWCDWHAPLTEADIVTFLLGPVLGVLLRRRSVLALHASAVVVDGQAVAFLGPGGSGKSTLAAAFAERGHAMLAEDIVALRRERDAWWVQPAYGAIRLWDDSAGMVAGGHALPPLSPTWEKRGLDLRGADLPMSETPAALRELYVLEELEVGNDRPSCTPVASSALLIELAANVYVNQFATSAELARDLPTLRSLAAELRGGRLRPGHGPQGLVSTVDFVASGACRSLP